MATSYAKNLSQYPLSISGDQIVQNIIQVGQSDGVDAVSLDHDFYGISEEGRVFSMASFRAVESGPNTSSGSLELLVYDSDGVSVPILTIGADGTTVNGSFNVKGGMTSFETTSVVVEDKDMVLASGATSLADLDQGGIILGTPDSGTKTLLYNSGGEMWTSNIGINIEAGNSFSIGDNHTVLDSSGLTVGDVTLGAGSMVLSDDISLDTDGLNIGDLSITPLDGLVIENADGTSADTVSLGSSGLTVGDEISITPLGGLVIENTDGAITNTVALGSEGLAIGDEISITPLGGLVIENTDGAITNTVALGSSGLTIGDEISITPVGGLVIENTDGAEVITVALGSEGLTIGDEISITPGGGLVIENTDGAITNTVALGSSGLAIGDDISLAVDSGLALGSDVVLDQQGLHLKSTEGAIFLGETGWKIAFDASTQHLVFEFYDPDSDSYVQKAEIKA